MPVRPAGRSPSAPRPLCLPPTSAADGAPESAPSAAPFPRRPTPAGGAPSPRQVPDMPQFWPLPEGGRAVGWLLGCDEPRDGFDEGQVGECLREVPHVLTGAGVDLLRVQLQGPGE